MRIPHGCFLILCLAVQSLAFYIFFKGFFPVKSAIPGKATFNNLPAEPLPHSMKMKNEPPKAVFGRLVIVLVDALRADFVFGNKADQHMPFTSQLIKDDKTLSFIAKAHPPTVTMPRIKAITTGGIPGFIDIVLNVDSSALLEDNLISQLYSANKSIVFYGDDTWIKLFPNHFRRTDGTTSFFVADYTEVDNNVTRHVDPELENTDWSVMILHYLGLDHIGHLAGPTSPLVGPKLQEMDKVIEKIYSSVTKQDKTSDLPTLIILCGDHGMSNIGSHGGASIGETTTPLVMMSTFYDKFGLPYTASEIQQIDVASTLSLLLGVPIPQNSLGRIITDPSYLKYNRSVQLHASWLESYLQEADNINHNVLGKKVITQYNTAIIEMSNRISASLARYDEYAMVIGTVLFWQVLISFLYGAWQLNGGHMTSISLPIGGQSSIFILIACCLATTSVHINICTDTTGTPSEVLCNMSIPAICLSTVFIVSSSFTLTVLIGQLGKIPKHQFQTTQLMTGQWTLIGGSVLHTLSLVSSSFVEEEHQTWYFFTMTINFYFFYKTFSLILNKSLLIGSKSSAKIDKSDCKYDELITKRCGEDEIDKCAMSADEVFVGNMRTVVAVLIVLLCGRLMRAWNQTGMKWADRPDIGDWFVRPENKIYLSGMVIVSHVVICIVRHLRRQFSLLLVLALIGVYYYRAVTGIILLPWGSTVPSKGVYEAWFVYAVIGVQIFRAIYIAYMQTRKTDENINTYKQTLVDTLECILTALIVLSALLLRPHNSAVLSLLVLEEHFLTTVLWRAYLSRSPLWVITLLHLWFGSAAFFTQGNSNSTANVDISAGYIGLDSYIPAIVFILTLMSTYTGPFIFITSLVTYTARHYADRYQDSLVYICYTIAVSRALPVAVYLVLISCQRYHLFVWSVFSPKLMYEGMLTIVYSIIILLLTAHSNL
uniref:GPI ethanolamine phosphate transferase 2-like n=1 Tax=Saccoglossus kowalevskii TaxID=10224 RepID=A0ABM0GTS2_SACKO